MTGAILLLMMCLKSYGAANIENFEEIDAQTKQHLSVVLNASSVDDLEEALEARMRQIMDKVYALYPFYTHKETSIVCFTKNDRQGLMLTDGDVFFHFYMLARESDVPANSMKLLNQLRGSKSALGMKLVVVLLEKHGGIYSENLITEGMRKNRRLNLSFAETIGKPFMSDLFQVDEYTARLLFSIFKPKWCFDSSGFNYDSLRVRLQANIRALCDKWMSCIDANDDTVLLCFGSGKLTQEYFILLNMDGHKHLRIAISERWLPPGVLTLIEMLSVSRSVFSMTLTFMLCEKYGDCVSSSVLTDRVGFLPTFMLGTVKRAFDANIDPEWEPVKELYDDLMRIHL